MPNHSQETYIQMASEVRRRKNAQKPASSIPSSSFNDDNGSGVSSEEKKRPPPTSIINASSMKIINSKYDEYAWFIVFLTALTYFIITRGGNSNRGGLLSKFSKPYDVVASSVAVGNNNKQENEKLLRSIFYVANTQRQDDDDEQILTLEHNRRLEVILSSPPDIIESIHGEDECIGSNDKDNNLSSKQQPVPYLSHLSSTTWVHDEELGRGYLLLADVGRSGRIWRWEVGGGPITIGRSLHMERSGCRSGLWVDYDDSGKVDGTNATLCPENLFGKSSCPSTSTTTNHHPPLLGSASLAVELTRNADRASAGQHIIVAEWGERRIVRVEGESGARTPLVTLVPYQSSNGEEEHEQSQWRRVYRPNHLMYTPFGDLLFSDNFESDTMHLNNDNSSTMSNHHVGIVYRRKEAVHIPGIAVEQSRDAHGWKSTTGEEDDVGDDNIDILFQTTGVIEGMALGLDYSTLFILVTSQTNGHSGGTKTVYKLSISAEDDDDEENDQDNVEGDENHATILYQMTSAGCKDNAGDARHDDMYSSSGSKLAVDEKGTLYLIACPSSLTLLSQEDGSVVGTLSLDHLQKTQTTTGTSVSFGEDGYLYITSPNELMRVKSRVGGMSLPTDMVVPPPLKQIEIGKESEEDQGSSKPRRDKRDKA